MSLAQPAVDMDFNRAVLPPENEADMIPSVLMQGLFAGNTAAGAGSASKSSGGLQGFAGILQRLGKTAAAATDERCPFKGQAFVEALKKAALASGLSLEQSTVDAEAATAFGDMLVQAGFDQREVFQWLSGFTDRGTNKEISLGALFQGAARLSEPETAHAAPVVLDTSALPYLEVILGKLGLSRQAVQTALTTAKTENQGIDLARLAATLKQMVRGNGNAAASLSETDRDMILSMMRRIGLLNSRSASKGDETGDDETDGKASLAGGFLFQLMPAAQRPAAAGGIAQAQALLSGQADGGEGRAFSEKAAGTAAGTGERGGMMSLAQFVSALADKVRAQQAPAGESGFSNQGMADAANRFLETVSAVHGGDKDGRLTATAAAWQRKAGNAGMKGETQAPKPQFLQGAADKGQNAAQVPGMGAAADGPDGFGRAGADAHRSEAHAAAGAEAHAFARGLRRESGVHVDKPADGTVSQAGDFMRELKGAETADVPGGGKTASGRPLPGYLLDQVSRQLVRLRVSGENELTLQLKPPHLGRMKLNVEHTAGGIRVGIVVEQAGTRDMLLAHAADLKSALADQGLQLEKIDVGTQTDFDRSMAQGGREFGRSGGGGRGRSGAQGSGGQETDAGPPAGLPAGRERPGSLNLVA